MHELYFELEYVGTGLPMETIELSNHNIVNLEIDFKAGIFDSLDNALSLQKRNIFPTREINLKLHLVSGNVFQDDEALEHFVNHYDTIIENYLDKSRLAKFFNNNEDLNEDEHLEFHKDYAAKIRNNNRIKRLFSHFQESQKLIYPNIFADEETLEKQKSSKSFTKKMK